MRSHTGGEVQRSRTELRESESLYDCVARQKHRWLKRVMYDLATSSSEKCFAYVVTDYLNCVTLDCWPSQKRIADQFGWSTKTVHRVSQALEDFGHLRISRCSTGSYRYAPVFLPEDEDKNGAATRHGRPRAPDKNVGESSLGILINKSSPSLGTQGLGTSNYDFRQRGLYETQIAKGLGDEGFEILQHLSEHDDAIVERLCRAFADGKLRERELAAAHLAALQLPRRRRVG